LAAQEGTRERDWGKPPKHPARPAGLHTTQIADPKVAESADLFSVSSVCADWQPRCAADAWHAEPRHALTDELYKANRPPADPPADELSVDLSSPFHFLFMSGHSSSAPGRARQRGQF